ncbi:MAG: preprotein translocase subunit SecE [Candidatus Dormibacteria bacterium]
MAKAVPSRRVPVSPSGSGGATTERGYLRGVVSELRKVIWPTPGELWRMTGIVLATVLIFAALIGAADYLLGLGVKQIYTSTQASPSAGPKVQPTRNAQPTPQIPAVPTPNSSAPAASP